MKSVKKLWSGAFATFAHWIFRVFCQPDQFNREIATENAFQRIKIAALLISPVIVLFYLLALLIREFLVHFYHVSFTVWLNFYLDPLPGITICLLIALAFGLLHNLGSNLGIGISIAFAIGLIVGIGIGFTESLFSAAVCGFFVGLGVSITENVRPGLFFGLLLSLLIATSLGIETTILNGIAAGTTSGVVAWLVCAACYTLGFLRLLGYPLVAFQYFKLYQCKLNAVEQHQKLKALKHAPLYWDERIYLPIPYLKNTLLNAYTIVPDQVLEELRFIIEKRPLQLYWAQLTMLEIAISDLEKYTTREQIATAEQHLNKVIPQEVRLKNPSLVAPLVQLSDASRDAAQSIVLGGVKVSIDALDTMIIRLQSIDSVTAFRDQHLNYRLQQVINTWLAEAEENKKRLEGYGNIGYLENPYKPGIVLKPEDTLFVGRRDLAQLLEQALSKGSHRPTLLLNGERRMGKTCTLIQLPNLLGSAYISILYNLQDPKIYATTSVFLGTLAQEIFKAMQQRGLPIKPFSYTNFQEATWSIAGTNEQVNDPVAYKSFDDWLSTVEDFLKQDGRTLLLAFDEFEKLDDAAIAGDIKLTYFLDWCRQIIQFHPQISLLFSGVHTFKEMGTQSQINWSNYFVNVKTLKVSFLKEDEARHLILAPVASDPATQHIFPPDVVDLIIYTTACHPFLIQALCAEIVERLNNEQRGQSTPTDVTEGITTILDTWNSYFDDLWFRTDELQRLCLFALNTFAEGLDYSVLKTSTQNQLTTRELDKTLRTLLERDLVTRMPDNTYCIAAPIFRTWITHNVHN